jgi:hypothetical protein
MNIFTLYHQLTIYDHFNLKHFNFFHYIKKKIKSRFHSLNFGN